MLTKQNIGVNFSKGLNTKDDPWQIPIGQFLTLNNAVFNVGGQLKKRNGNQYLSSVSATYLTTLNDNLTAVGNSIFAYNNASKTFLSKGSYQPLQLSVLPLIRSNASQTQCDTAISPNGVVCTVYTENTGGSSDYKFVLADSVTGQNIIQPTLIPVASGAVSGSPRVFLLENYFVIVFTRLVSSTSHLTYVTISANNPVATSLPTNDIASAYVASAALSWDGVVVGTNLYIAYNTTTGGQAIKVTYLSAGNAVAGGLSQTPVTFTGYAATVMSLCADVTTNNPSIYVNFYSSSSSTGYSLAVSTSLATLMLPMQIISTGTIVNIASAAQNGVCTIFSEVQNAYGYDSSVPTNYINAITVTPTGLPVSFHSIFSSGASTITASSATGLSNGMYVVDSTTAANIVANTTFTHSGTTLTLSNNTAGNSATSPGDLLLAQTVTLGSQYTVVRSVGLGSKAFIVNGTIYVLTAYESSAASGAGYQPTYFLINGSTSTQAAPIVVAKLAYSNGGGYLTLGLPSVTVTGNIAQLSYLFKDLLEAQAPGVLTSINQPAPAVYTQTGINLGTITIGTQGIDSIEIANTLQLSGGFGWMYDGYLPVEENFFLWPDSVEVTPMTALTPTGTVSSGSNVITAVSSTANLVVGMFVTDTTHSYIPANSFIVSFTSNTITINHNATGNGTGDSLSITGNMPPETGDVFNTFYYQVVYEWTDNQGNIYRSAPSVPVGFTASAEAEYSLAIINIPTLRLTYKINNPIKITIYRWSTSNQVYYQTTLIGTPLLNSTTVDYVTFTDVNSDLSIVGNEIIYTTGGVLEDVNSPASNIMTIFDTRGWKVYAEDPNTLWFSKIVIQDVPVEWSDLQTLYIAPNVGTSGSTGPVTALAPMDDKLCIFGLGVIHYINGTGPDSTGSNSQYSQPIFITSTVGCTNQSSIVLMQSGLMFQASDGKGIWLLGRDLSTNYIGAPVEAFNGSTVNSAVNVPGQNQVRFTLNTGETLVYDYYYNIWGTFTGVPAISSCIFESLHTFLNQYGQIYQENPGVYLDGSNPVLMNFTTSWLQLSGIQGYQRAYFFYLLGQYLSPHFLNVGIAYNFNPSITQLSLIQPTNFSSAVASPFGSPPAPFGSETAVEQWRVFLAQQRCQSFQITLQEIYDASMGVTAGAGLTITGLNLIVGIKKGFRPISNAQSVGGGTNKG